MASRFASEVLALIGRDLLGARLVRDFPVPSPAAGAEWAQKVPGGVMWEVLSVFHILTTSAVVANRNSFLAVTNADGVISQRFASPATVAANVTARYCWGQGIGSFINSGILQGALPSPPIPMSAGWSIGSVTVSLDVGDQYSNVVLVIREWDETAIIQEAQELFTGLDEYIESGYREGSDY